ncbi:AMP-binding protein [Pseudodesulfovibrio aespoeensis]|uniref:AMP-binding protein n=1 Tax=Pseudodesulfovibrio aespoeensis TaxID=182210 RepID=UPI002352CDC5|nr:AMP-binding protein [Pseudodesulfovibrio aespoeensis]MCG2732765.1 AMP-binding protein [Pseudodesulfovibrio aespoeensis]
MHAGDERAAHPEDTVNTEKMTLKDLLEATAGRYPDRTALSFVGGDPITYARFVDLAHDVATMLVANNVNPGDKVAIIGENMPNWAITYFAIVSLGAIAVPILQEFHISAVHHILRHSEAKVVIASNRYMHKVDEGTFPSLKAVVVMDDFSIVNEDKVRTNFEEAVEMGRERLGKFGEAARRFIDRKSGKGEKGDRSESGLTSDSVAAILYTSGTTGHSKGVVLTHGNLVANVVAGVAAIPIFETDRFLSVLPMAHTYECTVGLLVPVYCGASVHYLKKPPTPKTLLPAMEQVKPTVMNVVPLIIEKIYKSRIKPKLSGKGVMGGLMKIGVARRKVSRIAGRKLIEAFGGSLRCMCIGGAALSPEVERFLSEGEVPYAIGYGMTETSPRLAGAPPDRQRLRAIGPALPGVQLKIENPDPVTGEGEVYAKGPNVMREYYKAPKDTEDTFSEDGWLKTGDLGLIDADGYLFIKGRLKNVIIGPSGENIYPEEVESFINACDFVMESMVYEAGGKVSARIYLNYDALDDEFGVKKMTESEVRAKVQGILEDVRQEVNGKVSTFARLARVVEQVEPFEKTPTQKIKRFIYLDN